MAVRNCLGCGLVHDTLTVCSVARRLHASGRLPQPGEMGVAGVGTIKAITTEPKKSDLPVAKPMPAEKFMEIVGSVLDDHFDRNLKPKPIKIAAKSVTYEAPDVALEDLPKVTMSSPGKSSAERQAELKRRRMAQGLMAVQVWNHPDDHQAIKDLSAQLRERRSQP